MEGLYQAGIVALGGGRCFEVELPEIVPKFLNKDTLWSNFNDDSEMALHRTKALNRLAQRRASLYGLPEVLMYERAHQIKRLLGDWQ